MGDLRQTRRGETAHQGPEPIGSDRDLEPGLEINIDGLDPYWRCRSEPSLLLGGPFASSSYLEARRSKAIPRLTLFKERRSGPALGSTRTGTPRLKVGSAPQCHASVSQQDRQLHPQSAPRQPQQGG